MIVHFIGAGPGAPDLITVRGQRLIENADVVLYAGSLVPQEVVACAKPDARVLDTAPMTLDDIEVEFKRAQDADETVARVHSGDPSLYGAIAEQIRRLHTLGIEYDITPGVPAFAAAAATLGRELTVPELCQTVILTRTTMRSSAMPPGEELSKLGESGATLAIHLSIRNLRQVCADLIPHYGEDCPVAVVVRASWPDEEVFRGTLATIRDQIVAARVRRTALIMVGPALNDTRFPDSRLYDSEHFHVLRTKKQALAQGST